MMEELRSGFVEDDALPAEKHSICWTAYCQKPHRYFQAENESHQKYCNDENNW